MSSINSLDLDERYKKHKRPFFGNLILSTSGKLEYALTRVTLLHNPYFNKDSAFSTEERGTFNLHGLLPSNVETLDEQVQRAYHQYSTRENDLSKNTFMTSLRLQNEVLFYKLILENLKEMFPVIYTPTEGML
jgi:malate dehydrogenase (oxaloacetate-decarboxylating)